MFFFCSKNFNKIISGWIVKEIPWVGTEGKNFSWHKNSKNVEKSFKNLERDA